MLRRGNSCPWGPADKQEQKLTIHALAASEHRLYVAAGWEFTNQIGEQFKAVLTGDNWWSLYRSTDLGDTWYDINPKKETENERKPKGRVSFKLPLEGANAKPVDFTYSNFKIITNKATVMVADPEELFYSVNAGETWTSLELKKGMSNTHTDIAPPIIMLDANNFYIGTQSGVLRTADAGKSWDQLNTGLASSTVTALFAINGKLYAMGMLNGFVTSIDKGESWIPFNPTGDVPPTSGMMMPPVIETFNDTLYVKTMAAMAPQILRLSPADDKVIAIPGIPMIVEKPMPEKAKPLNNELTDQLERKSGKVVLDALKDAAKHDLESGKAPNVEDIDFEQIDKDMNKAFVEAAISAMAPFLGNFAVSGETYYVEYKQKLFRWKPGMTEWHNTGLVDSGENVFASLMSNPFDYSAGFSTITNIFTEMGFKITVSGKTIYVGKRDGHLAQSFDEGETWNDVTADLPFSWTAFNALTFAGSTIYVATDKGVAYSSDGVNWHAATDVEGSPLVMKNFAVAGTTVYGTTGQYVYELKENASTWKQVTPEIPDAVLSFAVDGNVLYVGTSSSGVLRFTLEE